MISVQQLRLRQGDFELSSISFEIPQNAYAILMGATGSGKTTLLESICGLRAVSGGKICIDGEEITRTPPAQRQIGYVPQDSSLFLVKAKLFITSATLYKKMSSIKTSRG